MRPVHAGVCWSDCTRPEHGRSGVSPLEDRRQRAREAFYDGTELGDVVTIRALESAIETAIRVRITDEAVALVMGPLPRSFTVSPELLASNRGLLADALRELGFEVEE